MQKIIGNDFVESLQESVRQIKTNRVMEDKFMLFHEMMKTERREGRAEGRAEAIVELLEELGSVSDELREEIMNETDISVLKKWLKMVVKSESVEQFEQQM